MAGGKDTVRNRAYEIWESEGRPHGRHVEHWVTAEQEIAERSGAPAPGDSKSTAKPVRKTAAKSQPNESEAEKRKAATRGQPEAQLGAKPRGTRTAPAKAAK